MEIANRQRAGDRIAGAALIAGAAATVLAMAHHPTGAHGAGGLAGLVHGAMIVLLALQAFGFAHFAIRRGIGAPAMLAGLIAYGASLFAHVGAATINGFIVPAIAARGPGAVSHDVFLFAWEANQALAKLGVYATGTAFILWGLHLLRTGGAWPRSLGLAGLAAGAAPAVLLAVGAIRMDVAGAFLAYAIHAAWAALVGLWLIRGETEADASA